MNPETHRKLYGNQSPPTVAPLPHAGQASIVVRTKDGRVFNLGKPESFLFPLRRWWYLFRRRHEFKGGKA